MAADMLRAPDLRHSGVESEAVKSKGKMMNPNRLEFKRRALVRILKFSEEHLQGF